MNDVDYSISEQRNKLYSHKKLFSPKDAAAIMLNIDPMYLEYNNFPDVELLANILIELAENGEFEDFEYDAEFNVQWVDKISAKELEQWALSNEYHWVNYSSNNNAVHNIAELHQQLKQERSKTEDLQTRIAELECQKQPESAPTKAEENYNQTERETHLQIIAMLAMKYAESNKHSLMTATEKINQSALANVLKKEAEELFITPRNQDAFRKRIAEAIKYYSPKGD